MNNENIPKELIPVLNEIARELYRIRGYEIRTGYDFSMTTHPHEQQAWAGAIASLQILEQFCIDRFGTTLSDLVDEA